MRLAELLDRARMRGEPTVVTRHNRPAGVLTPVEAYYLLVDADEGDVVAVGPFADHEAARDWEDGHEGQLGTVRGVVRTVLPDAYLRDQNKEV